MWPLAAVATAVLWGTTPAVAEYNLAELQNRMNTEIPEAKVRALLFGDTKGEEWDKYNPNLRPAESISEAVDVKIGIALKKLLDVDVAAGVVTLHVWLRASWSDPRLYWNSTEYGGLTQITAWPKDVWIPDWIAYDTVEVFEDNVRHDESKLYIYSDGGFVYWSRPAVLKLSLVAEVYAFPFDTQNVKISFGSWSNNGFVQDLNVNKYKTYGADGIVEEILDGSVDLNTSSGSTEFDISTRPATKELKYYACCPEEPWPMITFYLDVKRKPGHYMKAIILPNVFTTIISFTTFALPHACGERIGLGITCVLVIFASMFVSTDLLPATDEATALGNLYLGCFLYCLLALFATTLARTLTSNVTSQNFNFFIRDILFGLNKEEAKRRALMIDATCGVVFPVTFAGFCCLVLLPWLSLVVRIVIAAAICGSITLLYGLGHFFGKTTYYKTFKARFRQMLGRGPQREGSDSDVLSPRDKKSNDLSPRGGKSPRGEASVLNSDIGPDV